MILKKVETLRIIGRCNDRIEHLHNPCHGGRWIMDNSWISWFLVPFHSGFLTVVMLIHSRRSSGRNRRIGLLLLALAQAGLFVTWLITVPRDIWGYSPFLISPLVWVGSFLLLYSLAIISKRVSRVRFVIPIEKRRHESSEPDKDA